MFDFSALTYRFYSQTVPVLSFFNVPDIVMRRRSICRRRTKSIVVFVFVLVDTRRSRRRRCANVSHRRVNKLSQIRTQ